MLSKLFYMFATALMLSALGNFTYSGGASVHLWFFISDGAGFNCMSFLFSWSSVSALFILMVLTVTCMVLLYSEVYMEHYNNKKFVFLLILFFLSMLVLSVSDSVLPLMLGWDGLGVSSICLIMFYPNKNTLYNSLLTMFFNRLGDVLLISAIGVMLVNFSLLYSMVLSNWSSYFYFMLFLCSLTKSAQFPLSSWLPAAMSAPTPISAMVHSSTLVTAGVFLMVKLFWQMSLLGLATALMVLSLISFVSGGLMANFEMDFKKMVAFSTMSQISMIMFFVSCGCVLAGCCHMFFHALFKTLLFCCAGVYFITNLSDQLYYLLSGSRNNGFVASLFLVSIFSMSGFIFSSSFYSKDVVLEFFSSNSLELTFVSLLLGSILTLKYCCKMFSISISFFKSMKFLNFKPSLYAFIYWFLLITFTPWMIYKANIYSGLPSFLTSLEVGFITFIFIVSSLGHLASPGCSYLYYWTLSIGFMKMFFYSWGSKVMTLQILNVSANDSMIFKPFMGISSLTSPFLMSFKGLTLIFSIFLLLMVV